MNIDDYQKITRETSIYPGAGTSSGAALTYLILKLNGEAGEVAEKYAKMHRDGTDFGSFVDDMLLELGDVAWYITRIADELGADMSGILEFNVNKIRGRKQRGTLGGSGDHR